MTSTTAEARAPRGAAPPALAELTGLAMRAVELATIALGGILLADWIADPGPSRMDEYVTAVMFGAVFYAGIAEVTGVYDVTVRFSARRAWGRVLTAWMVTALFLITVGFLTKTSAEFSRGWALAWFAGGGVALCAARTGMTGWVRTLKRRGAFDSRVAIFGAEAQGKRLAKYIGGNDKLTISLVGYYDDRPRGRLGESDPSLPLLGNLDALIKAIRESRIDQVIVALPWAAEERLQHIVGRLALTPVRIRLAPDLAGFAFSQRPMVMLGDLPVMTLFERPISGLDQLFKKAEDVILGLLITIAVSPLLIAVSIAIKLDSPGPIFFRQPREGFNNRSFRIWKFRTMRVESGQLDAITQATRGDARITRVGGWLRRLSIDELPQLFNVLRGEMSLVGPRPHAPSTRAGERLFGDVVHTYAARHKVKPGITGWAQVCGWRGETDTEEKLLKRLEHDLYYIENWSIAFDLYVLVRTVGAVLFPRMAY